TPASGGVAAALRSASVTAGVSGAAVCVSDSSAAHATATTAFHPATPATTARASPRAPAAAAPGHLLTRSAQLTRYGRMGASSSVERLAGVSLIQDLSPQTVAA